MPSAFSDTAHRELHFERYIVQARSASPPSYTIANPKVVGLATVRGATS